MLLWLNEIGWKPIRLWVHSQATEGWNSFLSHLQKLNAILRYVWNCDTYRIWTFCLNCRAKFNSSFWIHQTHKANQVHLSVSKDEIHPHLCLQYLLHQLWGYVCDSSSKRTNSSRIFLISRSVPGFQYVLVHGHWQLDHLHFDYIDIFPATWVCRTLVLGCCSEVIRLEKVLQEKRPWLHQTKDVVRFHKPVQWPRIQHSLRVLQHASHYLDNLPVCPRTSNPVPNSSLRNVHSLQHKSDHACLLQQETPRVRPENEWNDTKDARICAITLHRHGRLGVFKLVDIQEQGGSQ